MHVSSHSQSCYKSDVYEDFRSIDIKVIHWSSLASKVAAKHQKKRIENIPKAPLLSISGLAFCSSKTIKNAYETKKSFPRTLQIKPEM